MRGWDGYRAADVARMDSRYGFIIEPFVPLIAHAKVLDIAPHDGRWSYAFAGAGAAEVHGVEGRRALIKQYEDFPETDFKQRVAFTHGDLYAELDRLIAQNAQSVVVAFFGISYHVMDHYGLLARVKLLKPKVIIIDSDFMSKPNPMIQITRESTDNVLNATGIIEGQDETLVGIPSVGAMERFAVVLKYRLVWSDWDSLAKDERRGMRDYFRDTQKCRRTCALYPLEDDVA